MDYLAALVLLGAVLSWFDGDTAVDQSNMVLPLYAQQGPTAGDLQDVPQQPRPTAVVMLQGWTAEQRPLRQWGVEAIAQALPQGVASGSTPVFLWSGSAADWGRQWRAWAREHGVAIVAAVSLDQQVELGPYPFLRPVHAHTLVDVAGVDVATGQVLFRAAGTDRHEGLSWFRPEQVTLNEERDRSLKTALSQVVAQLPGAPVLQSDGERVARPPLAATPSLPPAPPSVVYGERHPRFAIGLSQFFESAGSHGGARLPEVQWNGVSAQGTLPLMRGVADWVPVLAGQLYRMGVTGHPQDALTGGEARLGAGFDQGEIQLVLGAGLFSERVEREGQGGWRRSGTSLFFDVGLEDWSVTWQRREGLGWGWGLGYQWRF